jgi:tetratricopeptide (TPR) repeat protein
MSKEEITESQRNKALSLEKSNAREAMNLLINIINNYGDTWAVANLVLDDVIRIGKANGFLDEAIFACQKAQIIKSEYKSHYKIEERACQLEKNGDIFNATELRYRRDIEPGPFFRGSREDWIPHYTTLRYYGNVFADLNAHDKAWKIYNEAVINAAGIGESPHTIRQVMAKLLLKENKPANAVEILIAGICEAERWAPKGSPKSLIADLKRALKASGIENQQAAEEIFFACKKHGQQYATDLFYKSRE